MAYDEFKNVINKIDIITINPPEFDLNIYDFLKIFPLGITTIHIL